jgi:uncharacterized membrane protein
MNNKTRNILKLVAVIIVVVMVLMHIGTIAIPALNPYKFWLMVMAFGMVIISSK